MGMAEIFVSWSGTSTHRHMPESRCCYFADAPALLLRLLLLLNLLLPNANDAV